MDSAMIYRLYVPIEFPANKEPKRNIKKEIK